MIFFFRSPTPGFSCMRGHSPRGLWDSPYFSTDGPPSIHGGPSLVATSGEQFHVLQCPTARQSSAVNFTATVCGAPAKQFMMVPLKCEALSLCASVPNSSQGLICTGGFTPYNLFPCCAVHNYIRCLLCVRCNKTTDSDILFFFRCGHCELGG